MNSTGDFFFKAKKKKIWFKPSGLLRQTSEHVILMHCESYDRSVHRVLIAELNQTGESFQLNFER